MQKEEMKICFCSSIFDMTTYDELQEKSKVSLTLADHNLNNNLIVGLDENLTEPVHLINNQPIASYPKFPKMIMREEYWAHTNAAKDVNIGYLNLPLFKQVTKMFAVSRNLKRWAKENKGENLFVLVYDAKPDLCLPILFRKKFNKRIKTVLVVPDVPSVVVDLISNGRFKFVYRAYSRLKMWLIQKFDMFVLLTEQMKDKLNIAGKPYVIVEGIYRETAPPKPAVPSNKKIIFYSGALREAYGIKDLVEAVCGIVSEDAYELWICGSGDLTPYLEEVAQKSEKVKYFGYVNAEKIAEYQQKATVLINPRKNEGEYTKYSFPSKTMEYLASGKPVIGYHLDGIPEEYDRFIQYVEGNGVEDLRNAIIKVCTMTDIERSKLGKNSKEFILENKSPQVQCKKIVNMLSLI